MQIPKDEIKENIRRAALAEFSEYGYRRSSMRRIAQKAGITAGNIYSYFENKEGLFLNLLEETITKLKKLIAIDLLHSPEWGEGFEMGGILLITDEITKLFLENKTQFLILMKGSEGSKYENSKNYLIDLVKKRIYIELMSYNLKNAGDELLAHSVAAAIIEGILNIFYNYNGDENRLKSVLEDYLLIMLKFYKIV